MFEPTGLEVGLRQALKNTTLRGVFFLEASSVNVELTVVQDIVRFVQSFTANFHGTRKILPEHLEHSQAICHSKQIPKFADRKLLHSLMNTYTILMMQMMHVACLASPDPQKHQKSLPTGLPKTLLLAHLKHHLISNPRPPFCGHRPPNYSLRSPNTTQLRRLALVTCKPTLSYDHL